MATPNLPQAAQANHVAELMHSLDGIVAGLTQAVAKGPATVITAAWADLLDELTAVAGAGRDLVEAAVADALTLTSPT